MANKTWNASSGEWGTGGDWSPSGTPLNSDAASLSNGGTLTVGSTDFTAAAQTLTISNGTMIVNGELSVDGLSVTGGSLTVDAGTLNTGTGGQGGTVFSQSGNVTVTNYGALTVGAYITGAVSGTVSLTNGGAYYFEDTQAGSTSGNVVNFSKTGGSFVDQAAWNGTIQNFNTSNSNSISFSGSISSFSYSTSTKILTVHVGASTYTEHFVDNAQALTAANFSDAGNPYAISYVGTVLCYRSGTLIRTVAGDIAVEDLKIGDLAVTVSGGLRPVVWIGDRTVDCRADAVELHPIRVFAHAFGKGRPARDLYLSPGHPVLVGAEEDGSGGHLVPIMCLVNGTTVERVQVDSVTYWHVELDEHDILLAEGLPAESYVDLGSRPWFAGSDAALHNPDLVLPGLQGRCRPVAIDGPVVRAEHRRLDMVFATQLADACVWPQAEDCAVG